MEATIVLEGAGLVQNKRGRLLRGDHHIEVAIACGRGVRDDVFVTPFDGIADLGRDLGRVDLQVFHQDLYRRRARWNGHCANGEGGDNQARAAGLHWAPYFSSAATCSACCSWP